MHSEKECNDKSMSLYNVDRGFVLMDESGANRRGRQARLLNLIPDIVFSLDSSHRFIYVNDSVNVLGYRADSLIGTGFVELVHPDDCDRVSEYVERRSSCPAQPDKRVFTENGGISGLRLRLVPQRDEVGFEGDGIYAPFSYAEVFVCPEGVTEDGDIGMMGIIRNLAFQHNMEVEKAHLEEQLLQAQKLEAVGRLAGGIAHDFNNLLGAISGYAELIYQQAVQGPESRILKYSTNILSAAEHAGDLIGKLLLFANREKNPLRRMDIHDVLDSVFIDSSVEHDPPVGIRRIFDAESSCVLGDEGRLKNVFFNLLVNAHEAMPRGGEIVVRTEITIFDEKPGWNGIYRIEPGVYVCISVTDTGIGMDRETCRKVFEPFFTTKDSERGTGLGLAGVYGVVQAHNGHVHLYSEPGNGTTVRVYLPSLYTPDDSKRFPLEKTELVRGTGRIMVIDDEPLILSACIDILQLLGYEAVGFLDGEKAISYFQKIPDGMDLVLVDMIMPQMSGRDLFRRIRALNPATKCILTTGHLYTSRVQEILDEGFVSFIEKPFPAAKLSQVVSNAITGK